MLVEQYAPLNVAAVAASGIARHSRYEAGRGQPGRRNNAAGVVVGGGVVVESWKLKVKTHSACQ